MTIRTVPVADIRRFRGLVPVLCLFVLACGVDFSGKEPGEDAECLAQADCKVEGEAEYKRACVEWMCIGPLPKNEVHKVRLLLDSTAANRARSFRIWAIHPKKPDGGTVTCDELDGLKDATAVLMSGESYNVTSMPSEQSRNCDPCGGSNQYVDMQVQLDSPDRFIYVAGYPNRHGAPGAEGEQTIGKCSPVTPGNERTTVKL